MSTPAESSSPPSESRQGLVQDIRPDRAALDVGVQIAGRVGNLALGVVATAVLARALGEYGFGQWSTVLLIAGLMANLNDLGLLQVAVRRATSENDASWLGALVSARAALSIPVTALTILVLALFTNGSTMFIAGVIVALQGLLAAPMAMAGVFQVRVRNDLSIVALTVNSILWTAAVVIIAASGGGLVVYAVALSAIAVLSTALQGLIAFRTVRVPFAGSHRLWRRLAREAIPLSVGTLLIVAYGRIDGLIVYSSAGTSAAGLYNAAYRLVEQIGVVPFSLVTTLMPIATRIGRSPPDQARRLLQFALDILAMFSLPALAFTIVASEPLINLLYGKSFHEAAGALPVLTAAFVVISCGYALGVYTLVLGLQKRFARFALIALIFNVVTNVVLIPRYGFLAAAWTTLATEMLVVGLIGRLIFAELEMRPAMGRFARAAVAATITGAVTYGLLQAGVGVLLLLLAASLVQLAALFALGALSLQEIRAILRREPIAAP